MHKIIVYDILYQNGHQMLCPVALLKRSSTDQSVIHVAPTDYKLRLFQRSVFYSQVAVQKNTCTTEIWV